MHHLTIRLRNALDSTNFNQGQRTLLLSFALAQSIAYNLQLPSSNVDSTRSFYQSNHAENVRKQVSEFNEHFVVNTKEVLDLIFKIYTVRYKLVFEPTNQFVLKAIDTLVTQDVEDIPPVISDLAIRNLDQPGFTTLRQVLLAFNDEWNRKVVTSV